MPHSTETSTLPVKFQWLLLVLRVHPPFSTCRFWDLPCRQHRLPPDRASTKRMSESKPRITPRAAPPSGKGGDRAGYDDGEARRRERWMWWWWRRRRRWTSLARRRGRWWWWWCVDDHAWAFKKANCLLRRPGQTDRNRGLWEVTPLCTRICPYPFFEAIPPGAAPGPPVKTGARVRRFRGCNKGGWQLASPRAAHRSFPRYHAQPSALYKGCFRRTSCLRQLPG